MSDESQHDVILVGCSHHETPLEVREQLALPKDAIGQQLYQEICGNGVISECLVVATCNRLEYYVVGTPPVESMREKVEGRLFPNETAEQFRANAYLKTGPEATRHLFEVAAGLDSQMLGETEILGQLKAAYAQAANCRATGTVLNRLLQKAFQAAKWARSETAIGRGQVSIGNVAVELAERVCGELSEISVLLVGTGEVGSRTAQALMSRGVQRVTVTGRNTLRAREVADTLTGAAVISFGNLERALAYSDVLISCTGASEAIINAEIIGQAMAGRPDRPLFVIDLAMPRDVAPDAESLPEVYLFNLDNLASIANENLKTRKSAIETARKGLTQRAARIWEELRGRL